MNDSQPPSTATKTSEDDPNLNPTETNDSTMTEDSSTYARNVAHTASIKLVDNRYKIPVTLKFSLKAFETTININQKHVCIFAAIKLIDPSVKITFPNSNVQYHTKHFHVTKNKRTKFL